MVVLQIAQAIRYLVIQMNQTARVTLAVHLTMMFQMILIIFGALNFHARMCFIFIPATIQGNVLFSTYLLVAMEHMNG